MTSAEPPASPDPAPLASPAVWTATIAGVARHTASLNLRPATARRRHPRGRLLGRPSA